MKTDVTEIADKIFRLSTFLSQVGPTGFTFNQFLIDAEQPLLFHYGQRALFPLVSEAVKSVIALDKLAWTTCSHVEADESRALNEWLAAAPDAPPPGGAQAADDRADAWPRLPRRRRRGAGRARRLLREAAKFLRGGVAKSETNRLKPLCHRHRRCLTQVRQSFKETIFRDYGAPFVPT